MGTINYFTSDYITLGYNEPDPLEYTWEERNDFCDEDFHNAREILDGFDFWYYNITIEPGYYEGFSIMIENNFPVAYNDYIEKREAQKEITKVGECLRELADVGLVACSPGWCTTFYNYEKTMEKINEAVKAMREESRNIPTWNYYENNIPCRRAAQC